MGKLQALNYTGHAIEALKLMQKASIRHKNAVDAKACEWLMDEIEKAVHFVVPLDGRIFDDGLRGIKEAEIHLPFPRITIEYQSSADFIPTTEAHIVPSSKRFIFAKELAPHEMVELLNTIGAPWNKHLTDIKPPYDSGVIFVASIYSQDDKELSEVRWIPCGGAWLLPRLGWDDIGSGKMIEPLQKPGKRQNTRTLCGRPVVLLSSIFEMLVTHSGVEMALRHVGNDMGPEAGTVLELIEALTCSNVGTSTIQSVKPAVNARRTRDGKMPLYETKVLTIDTSPIVDREIHGSHPALTGGKASPRQHLRRGHIREVRSGKRVWVQAHSVGSKGSIQKTYNIRKGV